MAKKCCPSKNERLSEAVAPIRGLVESEEEHPTGFARMLTTGDAGWIQSGCSLIVGFVLVGKWPAYCQASLDYSKFEDIDESEEEDDSKQVEALAHQRHLQSVQQHRAAVRAL
eukprot:6476920-Amphidinium_carterae.1